MKGLKALLHLGVPFVALVSAASAQERSVPLATAADYSHEPFIIDTYRTAWRFENDGTGHKEVAVRVTMKSDAGVQRWGQLVFGYNAANQRVDVTSVKVLKADGSVITAGSDAVQDLTSAVERIAPVYTDYREKHVTVPGLRPGDTLTYVVATDEHTALTPGHFWTEHDFISTGIVLDEELELNLPRDRNVTMKLRDGFKPVVSDAGDRRIYRWHTARLDNERDDEKTSTARRAAAKKPAPAAVRLTTFPDWNAVAQWYASLERTQIAATPELRKKAVELTAGRVSDLDKLQSLYEYVATGFRYVSLSFGIGRYQPHAAAEILRNQYGDCKDKHTLLASLAESMGFRVSAALVNSSRDIDPEFPSPSQFDHVITRVSTASGDVWLDATTEVAPFRLLIPTLRNKHALVVDSTDSNGGGALVDTPAESPVAHTTIAQIDGTLSESGALSAHVRLQASGDFELVTRLLFRQVPPTRWESMLKGMMAQQDLDGEIRDSKVSDPAAIREPFVIDFRIESASFATWTRKPFGMKLPLGEFLSILGRDDDDDTGKLDIVARSAEYRLRLEVPAGFAMHAPLAIAVDRDYGQYRASYRLDGNIFIAERAVRVTNTQLPSDRRLDYSAFRRVLHSDLEQTLSIERSAAAAAAATVTPQMKASELYDSGLAALDQRSYPQAIVLLRRATELEPAHKRAWDQLGRAYMALNRNAEAIAALQKQIEINAYDLYAYNNLGLAYGAQRRFAEAEAAYRKQLEINPLDPYVYQNLGEMYLEWKKYDQAADALEKAIVQDPKQATPRIRLGQAYLNLHQRDRAIESFNRADALDASPRTWNEIAYQLALNKTDLDLGQRYAESAVSAVAAASRNISIDRVSAWDLWRIESLAGYWDTLGWVHFARGDMAAAERFVNASWRLLQNAEVGDHLGQILEKAGKRQEAARIYALALHAERPDEQTRARLAALVGAARVDAELTKYDGALLRERTIPVSRTGAAGTSADFFVLMDRRGVEAVRFIGGDSRLQSWTDVVRTATYGAVFPDDAPAQILRRGTLSCDAPGACRITLMLPRAAQLAQQDEK
jgi:tetratricopeptide (TPR) repeat protein